MSKWRLSESGCWEWQEYLYHGYGAFSLKNKPHRAHRISYQLFRGPTPKSLMVCHRCNNKRCVNPDHLYLGTSRNNVDDAIRDGLVAKGSDVATSKLTENQVNEMRRLWRTGTVRQKNLAEIFKVDQTLVSLIIKNKIWKHCEPAIEPEHRMPYGKSKMTFTKATKMRQLYLSGMSQADIAKIYELTQGGVSRILTNESFHDPSWKYKRKWNRAKP